MKRVLMGLVISVALCVLGINSVFGATVKVLVVAGGGGGGVNRGGGGGGGGLKYVEGVAVSGIIAVTVGAGGEAGVTTPTNNHGKKGSDSTFDSPVPVTAEGGGGGGGNWNESDPIGGDGGSGGGAEGDDEAGGSGTVGQGNDGGRSANVATSVERGGGGGGGAGGAGQDGTNSNGGDGGAGVVYFGNTYSVGGAGNEQGGNATPTAGGANTGNGGEAGNDADDGAAGGSGIVIVRYVTADFGTCTGGIKTTDGDDTIHTFTSSGTFTVVELPTVTPTNTPTHTPTNTPTQTPTNTPTITLTPTQTPTNTPDVVPPDAPVINRFLHDELGQIREIRGTAEADATVYVYDGGVGIGSTTADGSGDWTFTPGSPLAAGPYSIHAIAKDASDNPSVDSDYHVLTHQDALNIFKDTAVTHSGGTSLRLAKTGSCEFRLAVNDGVTPNPDEPVTVKTWLRKNSDYTGTEPKVTLTGLGIDGTGAATGSLSVGADTWQQLTATGTPNAKGVVTLKVETFSTAVDATAWVDDISVSQ